MAVSIIPYEDKYKYSTFGSAEDLAQYVARWELTPLPVTDTQCSPPNSLPWPAPSLGPSLSGS